jgi:hypothetical protein
MAMLTEGGAAGAARSQGPCPAGVDRPWYVESGQWQLTVTDNEHRLQLIGPPDLIIGP